MKVKIFSFVNTGIHANRAFPDAETEINDWLSEHESKSEIVEIRQSAGRASWVTSNLVVSIWYKPKDNDAAE